MAKEQKKLTPEEKAKQKVIDSIRTLTDHRVYTLGLIEKILSIPQNTLSGMLSGSRNMPPKYVTLLSEFIKALPKEDKTITIKIDQDEPASDLVVDSAGIKAILEAAIAEKLPPLPKQTQPVVAIDTFGTEGQKVIQSAKKPGKPMPPGLTKSEQLRWHRENGQTLL